MNFTELTLRLLLLFFPGIVCYFVVDALTVHRERKPHQVFLLAYVYGVLAYVAYSVVFWIWGGIKGAKFDSDTNQLHIPMLDSIGFTKSLTDSNVHLNFLEIGLVTVTGVVVALAVSYITNHKWLHWIAKTLRISRKFSDPDVWSFVFNSNEVRWATVRDFEHNFMFCGYIRAFSDVEESAELYLHDVIVYNEATGAELYRADRLYLSRKKDNLTIEFPNVP